MPIDLSPNFADVVMEPLAPAAKVGVATGLTAACIGGGVGIIKSAHPGIAAVYTGAQCFVFGSSFVYTRQASLQTVQQPPTRRHELIVSAVSGAVSGAAAGRFWSRGSAVSGAFICAALGYLGQRGLHRSADAKPVERDRRTLMQKLADSRLSPIKSLSNDDYENMLLEKLIRVEADIGVIDEKLSALKASANETTPK